MSGLIDLSYRYSDQSVPYYFNNQGKLVMQNGRELPSEIGISRKIVETWDSNGNSVTEVQFVQEKNQYYGQEKVLTSQEVQERITNYYNYKKTEKKIQNTVGQQKNPETSTNPKVQPKVTNTNNKTKTENKQDSKSNADKSNTNEENTSTDESTVSTTATSSGGSSSSEATKKDQGPKFDELYRYTDSSGDEYDPSVFNVGVVRNLDENGNISYKYINLETNDEMSEAEYKQRAQDYVNKHTGADVKNIDQNLESLQNGYYYQMLANASKSKTNKDSEMQSGNDFGSNENIVLTDEILANQGLLGFHPINGKILKTKLNETYEAYLGIGCHGHELDVIKAYRNKLFGSSFQFLDSVDKRFSSVNDFVGYEFLRNFILHSAILHIYPGMPHYQGSVDPFEWLRNLADAGQDQMSDDQHKVNGKSEKKVQDEIDMELAEKEQELLKKDSDSESEYNLAPGESALIKNTENELIDQAIVNSIDKQAKSETQLKTTGTKSNSTMTGIVTALFSILFKTKYQRRLFGIKYTYEQYMRYVNLMCRSLALFLNLTVMNQIIYPQGTFINAKSSSSSDETNSTTSKFVTFDAIDWSNYRMIEDSLSYVNSTLGSSLNLLGTMFGMTDNNPGTILSNLLGNTGKALTKTIAALGEIALGFGTLSNPAAAVTMVSLNAASVATTKQSLAKIYRQNANALAESIKNWDFSYMDYENRMNNAKSAEELEEAASKGFCPTAGTAIGTAAQTIVDSTGLSLIGSGFQLLGDVFKDIFAQYKTVQDKLESRTQSVEFMVEPFSPNEQFSNQTTQSLIKGLVDKAAGIGTEVAFITQTQAVQDSFFTSSMEKLAKAGVGLMEGMNNLASQVPLGGSFLHNLVSGALGAVTGNRFIYPDIYQSSSSQTSFNFKVNLISPYGDVYNYFMNILVPLAHLYCLVNPRLVTANSSNSPFLVRAFVPGLATCEMGIIDSMTIHKNSEGNRVSTNGLPLSVTVEFSIHELYHHNAISPWDDPLSVINNECLLDYLCNLAGIPPTYTRRKMITASLSSILKESLNVWKLAGNTIGDIMLGWFGTNFGTKA